MLPLDSDHFMFFFSNTDMLIHSCFSFFLPILLLRGMPLLWRLHEGSSPQAPLHSEWMGDKPGVSEGMASLLLPVSLLPYHTRRGSTLHRGTELMGGYILDSELVKMSLCLSTFMPSHWRMDRLSLHLPLAHSPAASSWDLKIKLSLSSFSHCHQPGRFCWQNLADDFTGDTWSHTDSRVALPGREELCKMEVSRSLLSLALYPRVKGRDWGSALPGVRVRLPDPQLPSLWALCFRPKHAGLEQNSYLSYSFSYLHFLHFWMFLLW